MRKKVFGIIGVVLGGGIILLCAVRGIEGVSGAYRGAILGIVLLLAGGRALNRQSAN